MKGSRINNVTPSSRRVRIGKDVAEARVTSPGAYLGPLHFVCVVGHLDKEIVRNGFRERRQTDFTVELVDRREKRFEGNDIDVDAGLFVVPELILKRRLRAVLPHHAPLLGLQPAFQNSIARYGPVWIEGCGLLFFFLRQKEKVNPDDGEQHSDASTDVRADCRFFLAGDSAPIHLIEMNAIESAIGGLRQDGIRLSLFRTSITNRS